jgi:hypothetical protein
MLSQQERQALAAHFKDRDLYDPSKDPSQDAADFAPKCYCGGGHVTGMCGGGMAMDTGGEVSQEVAPQKTMIAESDFPSMKDLLQKPPTHKGMVAGIHEDEGPAVQGYAHGGSAQLSDLNGLDPYAMDPAAPEDLKDAPSDSFSGPSISADSDTFKGKGEKAPLPAIPSLVQSSGMDFPVIPRGLPAAPQRHATAPQSVPAPQAAPAPAKAAPAASQGSKLAPDEYARLVSALSQRPTFAQGAMSGLAGLADGIMQGVARAGNPGFQKNIMESQQNHKQNLIQALRDKYESGFRDRNLNAENTRAANALKGENDRSAATIKAENDRAAMETAVRAKEADAQRAQQGLEAAAKLPATGILHPSTWGRGDEIEAQREQLARASMGGGAHPQDAQALAWAQSHPNDPRAVKILRLNGH